MSNDTKVPLEGHIILQSNKKLASSNVWTIEEKNL